MKTIRCQLQEIHTLGHSVLEITQNYSMGFIDVMEMMGQIHCVNVAIGKITQEICEEYEINQKAVQMMLNL